MFETEVFWKQMFRTEDSDFSAPPAVISPLPRYWLVDRGIALPLTPSLRLCALAHHSCFTPGLPGCENFNAGVKKTTQTHSGSLARVWANEM